MNQKKAKAIRRYVRSLGLTKAELNRPRSGVTGYTDPVTRQEVRYDLPLTARYPDKSFQHAYRMAKRLLAGIRTAVINDRARIQEAGLSVA